MSEDTRFAGRGALTAAAVLWLLTGAAHGLGGVKELLAGPDPDAAALVAEMRKAVMVIGPLKTDTYDVFRAFSWLFTVFLFSTGASLLFGLRYVVDPRGRRMLAVHHVVYAALMIVVCLAFMAPPPVPFGLVIIGLCLWSLRRQARADYLRSAFKA